MVCTKSRTIGADVRPNWICTAQGHHRKPATAGNCWDQATLMAELDVEEASYTLVQNAGRAAGLPYIRWNLETLDRPGRGTSKGIPLHEPSHRLDRVDPSDALEFWTGRADIIGRFCNCPRSHPAVISFGRERAIRARGNSITLTGALHPDPRPRAACRTWLGARDQA
jgi:hypothetical protein